MGMRKSTKTVRLQGLSPEVTNARLNEIATELCKKPPTVSSQFTFRRQQNDGTTAVQDTSLVMQSNKQTATITYVTERKKERATTSFKRSPECEKLDDEFSGLTVLYGGDGRPVDLDICAVHGLGGHAFDTWMATTKMWLRDHLPGVFPTSRIMTFGYNSNLMDGKININSGLQDFADTLFLALESVRTTHDEQRRPVLFICHSMGGLVARLLVTHHWRWRNEKYKSVRFGHYGLLFLSTPHIGARMADYSDLALDFAWMFANVRKKLVDELKTFNPSLEEIINDWRSINPQPIVRCLCETNLTQTQFGPKQIVTSVSAGFMGETASPVPGTDHHTVCRFETSYDESWNIVLGRLRELRRELLERNLEVGVGPANVYQAGRPPTSAPSFPPRNNHYFYNEIFPEASVNFVGRARPLEKIRARLDDRIRPSKIALTGIAGAGKTEILLQMANEYRSSRSVFLLPASADKELQDAMLDVASMMGHDVLEGHGYQGRQLQVWNNSRPEIQIRKFMSWVDRGPGFGHCIVMLDDLDGLSSVRQKFNTTLSNTTMLISSRNPVVTKKMGFEVQPVSSLELDDMSLLLRSKSIDAGLLIHSDQHNDQLNRLASSLDLHAFAACAASTSLYHLGLEQPLRPVDELLRQFIDSLEGSGSQACERLLNLELLEHGRTSIMKLYESSLERMKCFFSGSRQPFPVRWMDLLELMAFLQPVPFLPNPRQDLHIFDFVSKVNAHLDDVANRDPPLSPNDVFREQPGEILDAFVRASLGLQVDRLVLIPALWRACVMQGCKDGKREFWLREILLRCFHVCQSGSEREHESMMPYLENCIRIAKRFNINYESLLAARKEQRCWIIEMSSTLNQETAS